MNLQESANLYALVLRQLLPAGVYDTSAKTTLAKDIYAHALAFAQADLDAKRLLNIITDIPVELLPEYERDYGLPLKCTLNATKTVQERIQTLKWVMDKKNVLSRLYVKELLAQFGITLLELVNYKPMQCTAPCTSPVNTDVLRYKVKLKLKAPVNADINCIIENYLPAYMRYDIEVI
ncbi:DUF2313 domain-containing protein [Acinetobacter sp. NIPH1876]|uniref:putative phage tail protein n=1 Tax=Acinetobacter sp. NIPH1876 TaxID=2924041 RepID=UPI001FAC1C65|nr:putative phage tail protein [Acinetobacter sp. NIPH1876]MCJ0830430.1 DUF2313 domain-containing protein [Acinetobacter sp. NIPH1876]